MKIVKNKSTKSELEADSHSQSGVIDRIEPIENSKSDLSLKNDYQIMKKWENNLLGIPIRKAHTLIPGIMLIISILFISIFLSQLIGVTVMGYSKSPISSVMIALLLGMIMSNIITIPEIFSAGINFSRKKILRLGIVMLGIRLALTEVIKISVSSLPIIVVCIISALFVSHFLSKGLSQSRNLSTLIAVGTSICGVSAIVATSPLIEAKEEETAYSVAIITIFGLIATIVYPLIGYYIFGGDSLKVGLWLGTSIQDTSQVSGAAMVYSQMWEDPLALDVASITKLVRNVFMVVVIPLLAINHSKRSRINEESKNEAHSENRNPTKSKKKRNYLQYFPKFLIGFIILSLIRSIGDWGINNSGVAYWIIGQGLWTRLISVIKTAAGYMFILALAGVGLSTRFNKFKGLGIKPLLVGFFTAVSTGVISFLMITFIG